MTPTFVKRWKFICTPDTLLNKLIRQGGYSPLNYKILIKQTNNNGYLLHVDLQYKNYILMSSGNDKVNEKQNVAWNSYQTLINESEKTYQNAQPNFISKNCKKLSKIYTQNKFAYPKYTVLRIKTLLEDSTYIEILQKASTNVLNANIDLPISTINFNIYIPYRFMKSTLMEHYYDEPTHVPSYQKKIYRIDSMGVHQVQILRNFKIKYGLQLPQDTVYADPNSKIKLFFLAQINMNDHFAVQAGPISELAENIAATKISATKIFRIMMIKNAKKEKSVFKSIQGQN